MNWMGAAALGLSCGGYLLAFARVFGGWPAPLLALCALGLFLYFGALAGGLELAAALALAGGLACLAACLLQGRRPRAPARMGAVCFLAGCAPFLWQAARMQLTHYDNFSHWALVVKYLLCTGALPAADTALVPFRDYPPGTAVLLFYFCRWLGRGQGIMLLGQTALLLACFGAVFGAVGEPRRFLLYAFLGAGCAMLSYLNLTIRINSLLVDFLLPLLSLACLGAVRRLRPRPGAAAAAAALIAGFAALVKDTGLFFGAVGLGGLYGALAGRKELPARRRWALGALATGAALAPRLLWQRHLATALAGLEGKFDPASHLERVEPALYGPLTRAFLAAALDLSHRATLGVLFSGAAALALGAFARWGLGRRWRMGRALAAAGGLLAAYYGGLWALYLFLMPRQEALVLAGFERYACSGAALFAGLLLLKAEGEMERSFAVDIDAAPPGRAWASPASKRRYQRAVLALLAVAASFLYSEYSGLGALAAQYPATLPARVRALAGDAWPAGGVPDGQRYLVLASDGEGQVSDGMVAYVCRYYLFTPEVEVCSDPRQAAAGAGQFSRLLVVDQLENGPPPGLYALC